MREGLALKKEEKECTRGSTRGLSRVEVEGEEL